MARPIDAYTLNNDLVSWYNDTEDEKEKSILRRVMQRVVQAPTLTPPNEWVSVEERKPKYNIREDGELVSSKILCYCETAKTVHLAVSRTFYTARKGEIVHPVFRYDDASSDEITHLAHWMRLREPPDRRPPEVEEETDV